MANRKGLAVCVEIHLIGKYLAKGSSNYRKQKKKKERFCAGDISFLSGIVLIRRFSIV
jgi:hypothetical protein